MRDHRIAVLEIATRVLRHGNCYTFEGINARINDIHPGFPTRDFVNALGMANLLVPCTGDIYLFNGTSAIAHLHLLKAQLN